jgi:hypothetical protein
LGPNPKIGVDAEFCSRTNASQGVFDAIDEDSGQIVFLDIEQRDCDHDQGNVDSSVGSGSYEGIGQDHLLI